MSKTTRAFLIRRLLISFVSFFGIGFSTFALANVKSQEKIVALVIGNAKYEVSPLVNPVNDSTDIAGKLRGMGAELVYRENLKIRQIGSTLREFKQKLTPGSTAIIFYAGHGLQIRGENYFPAVDADIQSEEDIHNQSLSIKQLMDILEEAKTKTNIVMLDACRNNPFERRTRSIATGLASTNAPSGTLISYSTRPGRVAEDGLGRNGVYTEQLLKLIDSRKPIELLLKQLVTNVKAASKGRQEPWYEGSLEGDFCFGGCFDPSDKLKISGDTTMWESILGSLNLSDYERYLKEFPTGAYAQSAKTMIEKIKLIDEKSAKSEREDGSRKQSAIEIEKLRSELEITIAKANQQMKLEADRREKVEKEIEKIKQNTELSKNPAANNKKLFVAPAL